MFQDADHAARLFNLEELGFIYTRLLNPTVAALQERVATLEGGVGAVACASGHAAQVMALFPLMSPGDNFVASTRLYGGSVNQFNHAFKHFGWEVRFVDTEDLNAVRAAFDDRTKALFCESIANPGGYISDMAALASVAQEKGVPLMVDNTSATPYLCARSISALTSSSTPPPNTSPATPPPWAAWWLTRARSTGRPRANIRR